MDTAEYLGQLSRNTHLIRNFCMIAHVDHGKTTLSDFLLASNGVLSEHLAGEVRYLDSRYDEQEREITMKASSVTLRHTLHSDTSSRAKELLTEARTIHNDQDKEGDLTFLLHLVDSPGHIDFSSEVSTAIRVADGAVVIVDLVDCVTTQTMSMLRQVYAEGLSMVLVLNKIDLIITTMQLTPLEAYQRIRNIIENCNATLAAYVNQLEISGEFPELVARAPADMVWFSPELGNVVFSSCLDKWGFRIQDFARICERRLGIPNMETALWGLKFVDVAKKTILDKPRREEQPPAAVQLMLAPLWQIYTTFLGPEFEGNAENFNVDAAIDLSKKMNVDPALWNRPRSDCRGKLVAFMSNWLPIAKAVLDMICEHSASPPEAQQNRLPLLANVSKDLSKEKNVSKFVPADIQDAMERCDPSDEAPMVAFISSLIDTEFVAGQMGNYGELEADLSQSFVGFARIFSGKVKSGMTVYLRTAAAFGDVEGASADDQVECKIDQVLLLRGRGLEEVDSLTAGCLCGLRGGDITKHVVKYATVSNRKDMPAMTPPRLSSASIVRLAVAPVNPMQLPQLILGLTWLNKVDPQVEVIVLPTGEYVIGGAGEVHAERCIKDLHDTFAKIELTTSDPLVPFRETIMPHTGKPKVVTVTTPFGHCTIELYLKQLPYEVLELLDKEEVNNNPSDNFVDKLVELLVDCDERKKWVDILGRDAVARKTREDANGEPVSIKARPASWGPKKLHFCGAILFDNTEDTQEERDAAAAAQAHDEDDESAIAKAYSRQKKQGCWDAVVSGFQLACMAGPMMEEPLHGVAVVLKSMTFHEDADQSLEMAVSGQVMIAVKDCIRKAFEMHSRRIVEPMYNCTVYSSGSTQGKIYSVLARRRANIVDEVMNEGSSGLFYISCSLPVLSSFGLQDDLRIQTAGAATAQLQLTHWAIIDEDPYFVPTTKEELDEHGVVVPPNFAARTLRTVRKRKGLHRDQIVENATQQKFSIKR